MVIIILRLSVSIHQVSYKHYQSSDNPNPSAHNCDYKKTAVSVLFAVVHRLFLKSPVPVQQGTGPYIQSSK